MLENINININNILMDFYWEYYKELNPDLYWNNCITKNDLINHFNKHGKSENRKYSFTDLFPDFNWIEYKRQNPTLFLNNKIDYEYHYFREGRFKNIYNSNKDIIKPKIGLFLTGFGAPNIEKKTEILVHNLEIVKNWKDMYELDLYIYLYTPSYLEELTKIDFTSYVKKVEIIDKPGIVGEFIYRDVSKHYTKYDYILLFLDDIELPPDLSLDKMLTVYNLEKLDILGLPLTLDSPANHKFMTQDIQILREGYNYRKTNFIEYFFYVMSSNNFRKYLSFFTDRTKWCWGIDLALSMYGIELGILECYPIKHYYKAVSYNRQLPDPHLEFNYVRKNRKMIKDMVILKKKKY
jgi:hypothetical protein